MPTPNRIAPKDKQFLYGNHLTLNFSRNAVPSNLRKVDTTDRMIPHRGLMDFDYASYALLSPRFTHGLHGSGQTFKPGEPKPRPILIFGKNHISENDHLYFFRRKNPVLKTKFPSGSDRIMDAPGVLSEQGHQSLCWEPSAMLIAALQKGVFGCEVITSKEVTEFQTSDLENLSNPFKYLSTADDGKNLVGGKSSGVVRMWEVQSGAAILSFDVDDQQRQELFSINLKDNLLTCGLSNGAVKIYDVRTLRNGPDNKAVYKLSAGKQNGDVQVLSWSCQGRMVAAGTSQGTVRVWDKRETFNPMQNLKFSSADSPVLVLAWCPWQQSILATGTANPQPTITVDNVCSGQRCCVQDCQSSVTGLLWNPHVRHLVSGHGNVYFYDGGSQSLNSEFGRDGNVEVWSAPEFKLQHQGTLDQNTESVISMALSPTFDQLAVLSREEYLSIWKCWNKEHFIKNPPKTPRSPSPLKIHPILC